MVKKLSSLFLVLCLTGCITTGPKQSAVKEVPPEYQPDIIDCANLFGTDIDKIEKLYGNPDSVGIISAGEDYFSRLRYHNVPCMGRTAYLEIDEHGHAVSRIKIVLGPISGNEREQLVERIREEVIGKDAKWQKTSPTSQQWKGENGNVVNISFAGSRLLELERTSEGWLKFVNKKPLIRSRIAETKSEVEGLPAQAPSKPNYKTQAPSKLHYVTYKVYGSAKQVSLTYTNKDGETSQVDIRPPWEIHFRTNSGSFVYLQAQNETDKGSVTAQIIIDGRQWKKSRSSGAYVIASCSGIVGEE